VLYDTLHLIHRELLNENTRTADRLVSRMSDRVSVASTVQHVVVGWKNQDGSVEPIAHEPIALIRDVGN